ncbi:MAG: DeoR family transcriptional regulator, partial [Bacteroidetes bacterium]|nr:DeoR family transcriptional regulator [Fibrella sp.]
VEADENDLTYFVHYQVKTLTQAYADLKKYIARKNQEKRERLALQREGLTPRQAQIVDWFRRDATSTVSIKEVQTRLGVSNQTARNDMKTVATLGFITELVVNRKERHYIRGPRFEE